MASFDKAYDAVLNAGGDPGLQSEDPENMRCLVIGQLETLQNALDDWKVQLAERRGQDEFRAFVVRTA